MPDPLKNSAGVVGGTVSALNGGKFANGAYTAAFQHLLNAEAEVWLEGEKTPADVKREQKQWEDHKAKVKSEILSDGRLTRKEAELWYRIGGGDPLTVDATQLTIDSYSKRQVTRVKRGRRYTYFAHGKNAGKNQVRGFADWEVHGKVALSPKGVIRPELYNFEY